MISTIYHNSQEDTNQSHIQTILQSWASREVHDNETMYSLAGVGPVKRVL